MGVDWNTVWNKVSNSTILGAREKAVLCIMAQEDVGKEVDFEKRNRMVDKVLKSPGIKTAKAGGYSILQVDYNPATISFRSHAGTTLDDGNGRIVLNEVRSEISMDVELIFEDLNINDAFMWEKFRLSAGDMVSAGKNIYRQAAGNDYSVQVPIDGIVSLLLHQATRQVIFIWNELAFAGELTNARAKYTMFNPQGHPIRGTVALSIHQITEGQDKYTLEYWDNAYDKLFHVNDDNRASGRLSADAGSTAGNLGNLLQL